MKGGCEEGLERVLRVIDGCDERRGDGKGAEGYEDEKMFRSVAFFFFGRVHRNERISLPEGCCKEEGGCFECCCEGERYGEGKEEFLLVARCVEGEDEKAGCYCFRQSEIRMSEGCWSSC